MNIIFQHPICNTYVPCTICSSLHSYRGKIGIHFAHQIACGLVPQFLMSTHCLETIPSSMLNMHVYIDIALPTHAWFTLTLISILKQELILIFWSIWMGVFWFYDNWFLVSALPAIHWFSSMVHVALLSC